ncbi:hypothetical protein RMSM_07614, partial [Rhodopirellula maiorica SM1]
SDERCIRLGLREAAGPAEVTIDWPSGRQSIFQLNRHGEWLLVEGETPFALGK